MSYARTSIRLLLFVCILGTVLDAPTQAASRARRKGAKRIKRARTYFDEIMEAPDTAIPQTVLQNCRGIIVVRQYKAGFVLGAKGGAGLAMLKDKVTKKWSPPVFIKTGEGSIGFQIGGQSIDSIFLIMNKEGVKMLLKSKFKIGVDASAAAGPVGRDAEAKVGAGTAILVYARAKGLYVGATVEGGLLRPDGGQVVLGVAGHHASPTARAAIQVNDHAPMVVASRLCHAPSNSKGTANVESNERAHSPDGRWAMRDGRRPPDRARPTPRGLLFASPPLLS